MSVEMENYQGKTEWDSINPYTGRLSALFALLQSYKILNESLSQRWMWSKEWTDNLEMETTWNNNCLCVYGKQLIRQNPISPNNISPVTHWSSGNGENHRQEANASCLAILRTRSQETYDGKKEGFFFKRGMKALILVSMEIICWQTVNRLVI